MGPATSSGKIADEQRKIDEVAASLQLSAIHIDRVCHLLKGVERNTDRKENPDRGKRSSEAQPLEHRCCRIDKKIEVFEESKYRQIRDYRDPQPSSRRVAVARVFNPLCGRVVKGGRECQKHEETRVPPTVKYVPGNEEHPILPAVSEDVVQA